MPRKQNGLGNFKSFSGQKSNMSFNKPGAVKSPGTYNYPLTFGTRITRTPVEKYNIDSLYAKWRKGYEYYSRNQYTNFDEYAGLATVFAGLKSELRFNLKVYRFASRKSKEDTAVHYTTKREQSENQDYTVATINEVLDNPLENLEAKNRNELWCSLDGFAGLLHLLVGEEVQSNVGSSEVIAATPRMLFDKQKRPNVFTGTTGGNTSSLVYKVPLADLTIPVEEYVGLVAIPRGAEDFMPIDSNSNFIDDSYVWYFDCHMQDMQLDRLIFVRSLQSSESDDVLNSTGSFVGQTTNASASMDDKFTVEKKPYQQWFPKNQYIAAETIESYMKWMSIQTPPLYIMSTEQDSTYAYFKTVPIEMTIKLCGDLNDGYVAFSTESFTKTNFKETIRKFNLAEGKEEIVNTYKMIIDLDPYFQQGISFKSGDILSLGPQYTCSCPSYSHALVRSPEKIYRNNTDKQLKKNRQQAYPMPSAGSFKNPEGLSEQSSGIITTWASMDDIMSFSACKHTIGLFFQDHIQIQEPNSYPMMKDRLLFEEKIMKEFSKFIIPLPPVERSELNQSADLAWAVAQQSQLSDTELGSILNGIARQKEDLPPVMGRIAQTFSVVDPITKTKIEDLN